MSTPVSGALSGDDFVTELSGWTALGKDGTSVGVDSNGYIFASATNDGIYRSMDHGETWTEVLDCNPDYHACWVDSQDRIFTTVWVSGSDYDLYKGTDNGDTWTKVDDDIHSCWWMDETSNGTLYLSTYDSSSYRDYVWRSTDGDTWTLFYNITDVLHIHVVAVNEYNETQIYLATGDASAEQTYRYYNGTGWTTLVTGKTATSIWFDSEYVYFGADGHYDCWRLPHGETDWNQKEVFFDLARHHDTTNFAFDGVRIEDIMLFGTEDGQLWGSWDGLRWVKLQDFGDSGSIFKFTRQRPIYFTERTAGKIYRLDITREDLIRLYYSTYNTLRGSLTNNVTYVREERIANGTNHLDLTNVVLSDVEASIKGLSRRNYATFQSRIDNAGWEYGNASGWYPRSGGGYGTATVVSSESANGTYSLEYQKFTTDLYAGQFRPYLGAEFTVNLSKGEIMVSSAYVKGNVSIDAGYTIFFNNETSGLPLKSTSFPLTTSWQRVDEYYCPRYDVPIRTRYNVPKNDTLNYTCYVDSILLQKLEIEIAYQNATGNAVHNVEDYDPFSFYTTDSDTINASLTVGGQSVSQTGTLTNGTESNATSLNGILTGALEVVANIEGSQQCILKINGTRIAYDDSMVLEDRTNSVYHGRYYGTFSPTVTTTDLIAVVNLLSNITSVSYTAQPETLTLNVDSPTGTTSTIKVLCGSRGRPERVIGASSWSFDYNTNIATITLTHSSEEELEIDFWVAPESLRVAFLTNFNIALGFLSLLPLIIGSLLLIVAQQSGGKITVAQIGGLISVSIVLIIAIIVTNAILGSFF